MSKKIYKFIGPKTIDIAFEKKGFVGLKCSLPKDYNDPYELFLAIDFNIDPDVLAYYIETVGSIMQRPTTCFSNTPTSIPMWAHYAHTLKGFVLEFDEDKINSYLESASFGDVDYRDAARDEIKDHLYHAYATKKPRHVFWLNKFVNSAAYFTKHSSWSYEKERRLVVRKDNVEIINNSMILQIPINCLTSIISGSRAESEFIEKCGIICNYLSIDNYMMKIGRSFSEPYFILGDGSVNVFDGVNISKIKNYCKICREPITTKGIIKKCPWCRIDEAHKVEAAISNPLRMLDGYGLLEGYLDSCEKIWRGIPNK